MKILRVNDDYYDGLYKIHKQCFEKELMSERMFIEELEGPSRVYFMMLAYDAPIAYAGAWDTGGDYNIISVAVLPEYRHSGIAKALIKRLIEDAKSKNIRAVSLEVRADNTEAIKLYQNLGFIITNTRKFYYKNGVDAYIMWLYM